MTRTFTLIGLRAEARVRLLRFVRESNRIEGIEREPSDEELDASEAFLELPEVTIAALEAFVVVVAPGALLRRQRGMNVAVGNHRPPPGGPEIEVVLSTILGTVADVHPYNVHVAYETLHPFMDGNGRSGRILWAWQMVHQRRRPGLGLGFLHAFYYQSLEQSR